MRVVAQRDEQFLVTEDGEVGHVYDQEQDLLGPEMLVQAILNRGYWEDATGEFDGNRVTPA